MKLKIVNPDLSVAFEFENEDNTINEEQIKVVETYKDREVSSMTFVFVDNISLEQATDTIEDVTRGNVQSLVIQLK